MGIAAIAAVMLAAIAIAGGLGASGSPATSPGASAAATAGTPAAAGGSAAAIATAGPTARPSTPSASPTATPTAVPSPSPAVPGLALQLQLDSLRSQLSIPGMTVAILWNDGRSWVGASGEADVAAARPVMPDTGFALASISKTFTAAVVLQLVEQGLLRLDEPVAPWLPAYRLDRRITVRMLLDHTSGLPDFFLNRKIDRPLQSAPDATWTPARSWGYVAAKRPVPGTRWTYSNTNYLLLGELVTAVTGRPLSTEVRDRLLDPLGLADTWYQVAEPPRTTLTVGYRLVAKSGGGVRPVRVAPAGDVMPFRSVITAAGGAGSIASTALDTARWMHAFASGQVLSPSIQRAMIADAVFTTSLGARIGYGLGIQVTTVDGRTALGHSGRYLGFRDVVRYLPVEGVTIAVLTNQGAVDPARIASAMLKVVLPPLPAPSPPVDASPSASPTEPVSGSPGTSPPAEPVVPSTPGADG